MGLCRYKKNCLLSSLNYNSNKSFMSSFSLQCSLHIVLGDFYVRVRWGFDSMLEMNSDVVLYKLWKTIPELCCEPLIEAQPPKDTQKPLFSIKFLLKTIIFSWIHRIYGLWLARFILLESLSLFLNQSGRLNCNNLSFIMLWKKNYSY